MASRPPKQAQRISGQNSIKYGTLIPNRVFVGGIPVAVAEDEVRELFEKYGTIKSIKLLMDKFGVPKGYGFITYESEESVKALQNNSSNLVLRDRKINVAPAVQKHVPPYADNSEISTNSGSSVYMTSSIPYGTTFFSASQHYSPPPVAVLSPPPPSVGQENSSYYTMFGQASTNNNFVGSGYGGHTIFYPLQNTSVPIYLGNNQYSYQQVPAVPAQGSEFLFNSAIHAIPAAVPSSLAASSSNAAVNNRMTGTSLMGYEMENQAAIVDPSGAQYGPDLTITNTMMPHVVENQSVLQSVPNSLYYNVMPDVYPVLTVNAQDCGIQYCNTIQNNAAGLHNEENGNFEAHNYGTSQEVRSSESDLNSQEIAHRRNLDINYSGGDGNVNNNNNAASSPPEAGVNLANTGAVPAGVVHSLQATGAYIGAHHEQHHFQQHQSSQQQHQNYYQHQQQQQQQQQQLQQQPNYHPYVVPEQIVPMSTSHIQEYNTAAAAALIQNTPTFIYPNLEQQNNSQNYIINKLYLGSPVTPIHVQYPRTVPGSVPYANDRPPRNDNGRNNKKRYPSARNDTPPNIPKFPFYFDSYKPMKDHYYIQSPSSNYNSRNGPSRPPARNNYNNKHSNNNGSVTDHNETGSDSGVNNDNSSSSNGGPEDVDGVEFASATEHKNENNGVDDDSQTTTKAVPSIDDNEVAVKKATGSSALNGNSTGDESDKNTMTKDSASNKENKIADDNNNHSDNANNMSSNAVPPTTVTSPSAVVERVNFVSQNNNNNKPKVFRNQNYFNTESRRRSVHGNSNSNNGHSNAVSNAFTNNATAAAAAANVYAATAQRFLHGIPVNHVPSSPTGLSFPPRVPNTLYNSYNYPAAAAATQFNYSHRKYVPDFPRRYSNQHYNSRYRSKHGSRYQDESCNMSNNISIVPAVIDEAPKQIIQRPIISPKVTTPVSLPMVQSNIAPSPPAPSDMSEQLQNLSLD